MNSMCEWVFTYTPEGEEEVGPLGFKFVSFSGNSNDAQLVGYLHWITLMLRNGYDVPGVRIREED